jgi:hypothetical protein
VGSLGFDWEANRGSTMISCVRRRIEADLSVEAKVLLLVC